MVIAIRHIQVAGRVADDVVRKRESRDTAGAVREATGSRHAGESCHHTGRSDLANRVIAVIGNVNVSRGVGRNSSRREEARGDATTIRRAGPRNRAGQRTHRTRGSDFANDVVTAIGDKHISSSVEGNVVGSIEPGGTSDAIGISRAAHRPSIQSDAIADHDDISNAGRTNRCSAIRHRTRLHRRGRLRLDGDVVGGATQNAGCKYKSSIARDGQFLAAISQHQPGVDGHTTDSATNGVGVGRAGQRDVGDVGAADRAT